MGFSSGALVYAVLRTVLAVALVFAAAFGGRRAWPIVGQAVSDVACLAFMIAYVDPDLRTSLGWLALPLLLYVIAWEGWGAVRAAATESDAASDGVGADLPGTEEASRTHLALPMGPLLTEEQVGEVVRALASLP